MASKAESSRVCQALREAPKKTRFWDLDAGLEEVEVWIRRSFWVLLRFKYSFKTIPY